MQKYVDVSLLLLYREMPIKINRKADTFTAANARSFHVRHSASL